MPCPYSVKEQTEEAPSDRGRDRAWPRRDAGLAGGGMPVKEIEAGAAAGKENWTSANPAPLLPPALDQTTIKLPFVTSAASSVRPVTPCSVATCAML